EPMKDRWMLRVGDHREPHPARPCRLHAAGLAAERHAPPIRLAPIVTADREHFDAHRVSQRNNIRDQLVVLICFGLLRLRRAAIAALVGRYAAEPRGEMRKLVPPCAVRFGKAVKEDQRWRAPWPHVDHVEFNAGRKRQSQLFEIAAHASLLWFHFESVWRSGVRLASARTIASAIGSPDQIGGVRLSAS